MSYNRNYNTRNMGRYNSGQFVPAAEPALNSNAQPASNTTRGRQAANSYANGNTNQFAQLYSSGQQQQMEQPPLPPDQPQNQNQLQSQTQMDVKMDGEDDTMSQSALSDGSQPRPHWMKTKLQGVKKLSNKERRRRQNENLRRLLTPKNALMVLNEMVPGEQLGNFKVDPVQPSHYHKMSSPNFVADLTLEGHTYKGYGDNKMSARNGAAEVAIRDIIIRRLNSALAGKGSEGEGAEGAEGEGVEELPMIQLASFALHKLFSEWEYEGHKVPQLKPPANTNNSASESGVPRAPGSGPSPPGGPSVSKPSRQLPLNAAAMHPCMLLTYMRPLVEYREIAAEGDKPQRMIYTIGVDVDGATYIGKASNKKEARRSAALAACQQTFGVQFDPAPTAAVPQLP